MLRKSVIFANKSLDRVVFLASLLLFLICLFAMVDAYMIYAGAADKSVLQFKPDLANPESLTELSDDAVAWLTVDDTKIDYPVMQGQNNDEYLNKDPYGNYSLSGSIFLDMRNDSNFNDQYSLIYGHHMEYEAMFGALDQFSTKEYFELHRTGTLISLGGACYNIRFFASCKASANESVIFDPPGTTVSDILDYLKANAYVYYPGEASASSKIVALSTCMSGENIDRMIVFGVLTEMEGF